MAFELPPLPYDYSALEPTIDAATMKLHHDMHHAAYVKNLNAALEKASQPAIEERRRSDSRSERACRKTSAAPCATTAAVTSTTACSGRS